MESEPGAVATGSELETDGIVDVIEQLVHERDSGFSFPADLTQLEKELVMVWDEAMAAHHRAHEIRIAQMFEVLGAAMMRG
jgi:hypothetical protein